LLPVFGIIDTEVSKTSTRLSRTRPAARGSRMR